MIIIFISILLILFIFVFYNYNQDNPIIEYSIKFTHDKPFNNDRLIYAYNYNLDNDKFITNIFKKHNVDSKLIYFYNNLFKTIDKYELIYGIDKKTNVSKLYITTKEPDIIYGIEKRYDAYSMRYYKGDGDFRKKEFDKFIGLKNSTIFYNLFNIEDKTVVYKKYDQSYNYELNSYHFNFENYRINDYKDNIKKLLQFYNCNIDNLDSWLEKNKNYYIYWIGITKKDNIEVTIYYRKNITIQ
jgi:hypothetical protein